VTIRIPATALALASALLVLPAHGQTRTPPAPGRTPTPRASQIRATQTAAAYATDVHQTLAMFDAIDKEQAATAEANGVIVDKLARFVPVTATKLKTDWRSLVGRAVTIDGTLFNAVGDRPDLQVLAYPTDDPIYVRVDSIADDLAIGDKIHIYGIVGAEHCFKNKAGNRLCHPQIESAAVFRKITKNMKDARATASVRATAQVTP
jgi:hypothetical protein